jgi:endonuclease/exonuclease/phosphatase family metal-dependent hydrolase
MSRTRFKIATFNAYNLVLPDVVYYADRLCYTQNDYNRKVGWMAEQLRRIDANIVTFQEIFHREALQQIISHSGIYNDAFCYLPQPIKPDLGPLPALVTRLPVRRYGSITRIPQEAQLEYDGQIIPIKTFSRPVIWAQIQAAEALSFIIIVVHLKSKRPILPEDANPDDPLVIAAGKARSLLQRAAEALALRAVLVKLIREAQMPVIILGDFNDTAHAVTNTIINGAPPWRYIKPEDIALPRKPTLYNVLDIRAVDNLNAEEYSHTYQGFRHNLDHIFVSREFVRANPAHLAYVQTVQIFNDHLPDAANGEEIPVWKSDHGQVVATFVA